MVKIADGVPVFIETTEENSFKFTPQQLKDAITPKTKALILNSPSNPTGMVYTKDELKEIAKIAVENNIFVVSDEIYEELIYLRRRAYKHCTAWRGYKSTYYYSKRRVQIILYDRLENRLHRQLPAIAKSWQMCKAMPLQTLAQFHRQRPLLRQGPKTLSKL